MLKVRFDHHTAHGVEMFLECTKTEGWEINGWHEGDELSAEAIVCYCPECDGVREEATHNLTQGRRFMASNAMEAALATEVDGELPPW